MTTAFPSSIGLSLVTMRLLYDGRWRMAQSVALTANLLSSCGGCSCYDPSVLSVVGLARMVMVVVHEVHGPRINTRERGG